MSGVFSALVCKLDISVTDKVRNWLRSSRQLCDKHKLCNLCCQTTFCIKGWVWQQWSLVAELSRNTLISGTPLMTWCHLTARRLHHVIMTRFYLLVDITIYYISAPFSNNAILVSFRAFFKHVLVSKLSVTAKARYIWPNLRKLTSINI